MSNAEKLKIELMIEQLRVLNSIQFQLDEVLRSTYRTAGLEEGKIAAAIEQIADAGLRMTDPFFEEFRYVAGGTGTRERSAPTDNP